MVPLIRRSRLPELLKQVNMSQAEFSRRIGVSKPYVTQIIKRESVFSLLVAKKASDVIGCKIEDLYEWEYRKANGKE